ncbi:MAG: SDR family oxidoreductase [Candidatus Thermoplasmatota archaeon]|nr:SDR family oxidoreductase [Candidatus Thermoplasmatota archaeon]
MGHELNGSKVLVTGGAGFIGSNLCSKLLSLGASVVCLDNFETGKHENIAKLLKDEQFTLIEGDITELSVCESAIEGCDYVSHQAALGSVPRSIEEPIKTNKINIEGTLNVFVAAQKEGVKRIVYASSSSIYGDDENMPKLESLTGRPLSPYAITKSANEMYAKVLHSIHGTELIGLRYFNVFGRYQDPDGMYAAVIPKFIDSLIRYESPLIYGDGEQTRDFTYIENVVSMNIKALTTKNKNCFGECFNTACNDKMTVNELFFLIRDLLSSYDEKIGQVEPRYAEPRIGDIKESYADINKAKNMLDYTPVWDCKSGLEEAIHWYWENLKIS